MEKKFLSLAHKLADLSGAISLAGFRNEIKVENKSKTGFDPVTEIDKACEQAMRKEIELTFPEHGIIGEEKGAANQQSEYCWLLDPIDGTRSYITGNPLWGTLIGLYHKGKPLLGMMDNPFMSERFWSEAGKSYWQKEGKKQPISTSPEQELSHARLASTAMEIFTAEEATAFQALQSKTRLTRFGGDCYNYCLLASGSLDLVVEAGLHDYDIAALIKIIENAGGTITTWEGQPAHRGGKIIAAANKKLAETARGILCNGT